jgi:hypothetical protein
MIKRTKFADVPLGTRFKRDGRIFLKLGRNIAKDEHQTRIIFPSEMEVEALEVDGRRSGT